MALAKMHSSTTTATSTLSLSLTLLLSLASASPVYQSPSGVPAIVSPSSLAARLDCPTSHRRRRHQYHACDSEGPVVIDIRATDAFETGHIPGSVSLPFAPTSAWSVASDDGIMINFPPASDLFPTLAAAGITHPDGDAQVVIIGDNSTSSVAVSSRAALTLVYAGLGDAVGLLDGGFTGWSSAGLEVTVERDVVDEGDFRGETDDSFVVDMQYVVDRLGMDDVVLVDARTPDVYSGETLQPGTEKAGHIPGAVNIPAGELFDEEGRFKRRTELKAVALEMIPASVADGDGEVIVYCRTGVLASSWTYVLSRVLRWDNVKLYDGSAQEWSIHQDMELSV